MQVEGLEEVERAFVHVDYALRAEPEHKVRLKCSGASCPDALKCACCSGCGLWKQRPDDILYSNELHALQNMQ